MTDEQAPLVERIPSTDPRLGRHVLHDPRSRAYAFDASGITLVNVQHRRYIPILDQGQVGSCTGNAGIGCMGCDPYYSVTPSPRYSLDEAGAVQLYSDAETIDGDGPYPPNDNGSYGLSIAKALQAAGEISGYQHAFDLETLLHALVVTPLIVGINWTQDMFTPDADGRVHPTGALAGGHEIVATELDVDNRRVWFDNSWGTSWGVQGRFYLTWDDLGTLLSQQGDATIFTPVNQPAPTPTPQPTPVPPTPPTPPSPPTPVPPSPTPAVTELDRELAAALHAEHWVDRPHVGETHKVAKVAKLWLAEKGL